MGDACAFTNASFASRRGAPSFSSRRTHSEALKGTFDMAVIDPPFITREVWEKYAETARFLLKPGGAVMGSTIAENAGFMKELLNCEPQTFMPSIPTLVYQYKFYASYPSSSLNEKNPEIPDDDDE